MTEETINSMFRSGEWHDAMCAHCSDYTGCVSMADVPTCYSCLEKYYDEDGDELPMNVYKPDLVDKVLGTAAAVIVAGLVMASVLMENAEIGGLVR